MVSYNEKELTLKELSQIPEGNYFIRKKSHVLYKIGPPIEKSKLIDAIKGRGWNEDEVVIDDGNLVYLNLLERQK